MTPSTPRRRDGSAQGDASDSSARREAVPRSKLVPIVGGNGIRGVPKEVKVPRAKAKASLMDAHNVGQDKDKAGAGSKAKKSREERSLELITAAMNQLQENGLNLHPTPSKPKPKANAQTKPSRSTSRADSRSESRSESRADNRSESRSENRSESRATRRIPDSGRESSVEPEVPAAHSRLSHAWQERQTRREEQALADRDTNNTPKVDRVDRRERAQQEREQRQRAREAKLQQMQAAREAEKQRIRETILRSAGLTPLDGGMGVELHRAEGGEAAHVLVGRDSSGRVIQHTLTPAQAEMLAQDVIPEEEEEEEEYRHSDSHGEAEGGYGESDDMGSPGPLAAVPAPAAPNYRATTLIPDFSSGMFVDAQTGLPVSAMTLSPAAAAAAANAAANASGQAYSDRVQAQLQALQAVHLAQLQSHAQTAVEPPSGHESAAAVLSPLAQDTALSNAFAAFLQQHYAPPAASTAPATAAANGKNHF